MGESPRNTREPAVRAIKDKGEEDVRRDRDESVDQGDRRPSNGDKRVSPSPDPRPAKATSTKKKPAERDPSPQPPQKDPVQDDTRERDASPARREASRSASRPDIRRRGRA